MALPTTEETGLVEKFQARLVDLELAEELSSDMQLVRWIRARENDLDQAEAMFRKSLKWKEENDFSNILTWRPAEVITEMLPVDLSGSDNENSPVVIFPVGRFDLRGLVQAGHYDESIRYVDQIWERAMERMRGRFTPEGAPVTQLTCILDMDQLGMRTVGSLGVISFIKQIVTHFESNYPEILRICYVINSTRIFQILFAIVKPLLSRRTYEKVKILTTEAAWKPLLLAEIPTSQLPESYGGTASSVLHSFIGYKMKKGSDSSDIGLVANEDILRIREK